MSNLVTTPDTREKRGHPRLKWPRGRNAINKRKLRRRGHRILDSFVFAHGLEERRWDATITRLRLGILPSDLEALDLEEEDVPEEKAPDEPVSENLDWVSWWELGFRQLAVYCENVCVPEEKDREQLGIWLTEDWPVAKVSDMQTQCERINQLTWSLKEQIETRNRNALFFPVYRRR
jgi:hypothetical protein